MALLSYDEVKKLVDANNMSDQSTELVTSLIWKESGFDPGAKNPSSSATGLMQATQAAVQDVNANTPKGTHYEHSDLTDAAKNIQVGTYYLKILVKRWGTIDEALRRYGTGAGYETNILAAEKCLKAGPDNPMNCLYAIHR
jgi:soluble lytic murein transglycosylase-like protein